MRIGCLLAILLIGSGATYASTPVFPDADAVAASLNTVAKLVSARYDRPISTLHSIGIGPGPDDKLGPSFRVSCEMKLPFELADTLIEALAANPQVDLGRSSIVGEALPERIQIPEVQGAILDLAQVKWTLSILVCPHGDNDIRQQRKDGWAALRLALTTRKDRYNQGRLSLLRRFEFDRQGITIQMVSRNHVALGSAAMRLAGLEARGEIAFNPCFTEVRVTRVSTGAVKPFPAVTTDLRASFGEKARARLPVGLEAVTAAFDASAQLQPALGLGPDAPQVIESMEIRPAKNPRFPGALALDVTLRGFVETLGDTLERLWSHPRISLEGGTLGVVLEAEEIPVQAGGVKRKLALAHIRTRYTFGVPPTIPNRAERIQELARGLATSMTGSRQSFLAGDKPVLFVELRLTAQDLVIVKALGSSLEALATVLESLGDERLSGARPVRIAGAVVSGKPALEAEFAATAVKGHALPPRGMDALNALGALLKSIPGAELMSATFAPGQAVGAAFPTRLEIHAPPAGMGALEAGVRKLDHAASIQTMMARSPKSWLKASVSLPGEPVSR